MERLAPEHWVEDEETVVLEEDQSSNLEGRHRVRKYKSVEDSNEQAEEDTGHAGEQRSVYLDTEQGLWKCRHCIWTYQLSGPSIDHIQKHEGYCQVAMDVETLSQLGTYLYSPTKGVHSIEEIARNKRKEVKHFADANNYSLANGNEGSRINKLENQENIPSEIRYTKNVRLENVSYSDHYSEGYMENEITSELKIEEIAQVPLIKKSKLGPEIDLEKVLDEQDTHDLYCPNCNSCITRRVILRKRKRTVREVHPEAPPAKLQQVQHDQNGTAASSGVTEISHDREPDVFRCLSCFSFFIPTETGFNIFRLFGKKEETDNTLQQLPVENVNWISSFFKPMKSIKRSGDTGVPAGSATTIVQQMGESSLNIQTNPARVIEGDVSLGESQVTTGMRDTGVSLTIGSNIVYGADSSLEEELSSLAAAAHRVEKPGDGHSSFGDQDADKIQWQSFISNGGQNGDLDKDIMRSSPTKARYEGLKLHQNQIMTGDSDKGEDAAYIFQQNTTTISVSGVIIHDGQVNVGQRLNDVLRKNDTGEDILLPISIINPTYAEGASEIIQNINDSLPQATVVLTHGDTQIDMGEQHVGETGRKNDWDVLKSIVYGGLLESITSLSVVSSAAGGDANTVNIVALGLANLVGGLFVIAHDLAELRNTPEQAAGSNSEPVGRYWELLGRKANFRLHVIVAVLTYIVAGILPPVIYGFSFRESDNKEYKLIAIALASLLCIALLAIAKAHVRPQKGYIKSLAYYLMLGVSASGLSYVAGVMIHRLLEQLGLFHNNEVAPAPPSVMYRDIGSVLEQWASY